MKNDPTMNAIAMIGLMNMIIPDGNKIANEIALKRAQNDIDAIVTLHNQYMAEMKRRLAKAQNDAQSAANDLREIVRNKNERIINLETKVRLLASENHELQTALNDNSAERPAVRMSVTRSIPTKKLG